MASGTIELEYSSKYFLGQIVWDSTINESNNTSTINAVLQVRKADGVTTSGTYYYEFYLGSKSKTGNWYQQLGQNWTTVCSLTDTITHASDGSASFWVYGSVRGPSGTSLASHSVSYETDVALASIYKLTISTGTGASVTVKRTSSSSGETGTLSNGSKIYAGDVITVTFTASTGYFITTHTVGGTTFTSGKSYTVSGNTTIIAKAAIKTYTLSVTTDDKVVVTVRDEISGDTYTDGSSISHFSTITISCAVSPGYELSSFTVNGTSYTGGVSIDVTSDVTVVARVKAMGLVYIKTGSGFEAYQVYIYDGSEWNMYCPYIYSGSGWDMCA